MSTLSIVNAKKAYQSFWALKGIDLEIRQGEFFGLLGPNGAGKTTLISSIVGLCRLSEGSICVAGHDVTKDYLKARSLVGYSPQEVNLDRFFSIRKILTYQAGYFGVPRAERKTLVERLLIQFKLLEKADSPYYRLSGGMQRRVLIAKALVGSPKILILDEPTAGVDVEQRHELWQFLRNLNRDGTTIILTTHYIDEAEELCERIGIINHGEIKQLGTPTDLIHQYCHVQIHATMKLPNEKTEKITLEGSNIPDALQKLENLKKQKADAAIVDLSIDRGNLEEVFLKVTGERMAK